MIIEPNNIYLGDCLDLMAQIPDKSVDMILCDLPYGTTACKWDVIIPFDKLWEQYKRIIKDNGAIVLFGGQPFTSLLIGSNLTQFKYSWVWDKVRPVGVHVSKIRPMQQTEDIVVFGEGKIKYNPQMGKRDKPRKGSKEYGRTSIIGGEVINNGKENTIYTETFPRNLIKFSNASNKNRFHPTQKPVELCEYLIKTYSNEGDLILDNCAGSGSTLVAAKNLNRQFIGIEKEEKYFKIAQERLEKNG